MNTTEATIKGMNLVHVDFDKKCGKIKPMHAVNNGPTFPYDFYGQYQKMTDAAVPYARLHDTGGAFGGARYVDVANVFPNFDADETDPSSYDFAFTDVFLQELVKYGMKPFYRLGCTIENYHKIKAYNIYPPKDPHKWARICEHIIRHYNEGWADGFYMDIEHWEIWNEPDNEPDPLDSPMWRGTKEEFFTLYEISYRHLKQCFPHLKIGGYASCGFYALTNSDFSSAAKSSPRKEYFLEFFDAFLEYTENHGCGMDFFSWHSYADVERNIYYAKYAREKLDAHGFKDCEVYLNEWNPGYRNRGQLRDAADVLAMMCAMHGTPTDMLMYYDAAERSGYCGIFNPVNHTVFPTYYAFYAFGKLYKMGEEVACHVIGKGLFALAACGDKYNGLILVNDTEEEMAVTLELTGCALLSSRVYAVDGEHVWEQVPVEEQMVLPPFGIRYLEWEL
ncbi:MAG: hypothetical protein IJY47_02795 [Clostridia bacterium]|nr:hypothetical protein [Clostridia bacterium]